MRKPSHSAHSTLNFVTESALSDSLERRESKRWKFILLKSKKRN